MCKFFVQDCSISLQISWSHHWRCGSYGFGELGFIKRKIAQCAYALCSCPPYGTAFSLHLRSGISPGHCYLFLLRLLTSVPKHLKPKAQGSIGKMKTDICQRHQDVESFELASDNFLLLNLILIRYSQSCGAIYLALHTIFKTDEPPLMQYGTHEVLKCSCWWV
jgi:hypothetical protein